jgi:hypothetical protein
MASAKCCRRIVIRALYADSPFCGGSEFRTQDLRPYAVGAGRAFPAGRRERLFWGDQKARAVPRWVNRGADMDLVRAAASLRPLVVEHCAQFASRGVGDMTRKAASKHCDGGPNTGGAFFPAGLGVGQFQIDTNNGPILTNLGATMQRQLIQRPSMPAPPLPCQPIRYIRR